MCVNCLVSLVPLVIEGQDHVRHSVDHKCLVDGHGVEEHMTLSHMAGITVSTTTSPNITTNISQPRQSTTPSLCHW